VENIGSVLVGALVALIGTVLVQLWLIPLVDSRKRREQRWESDVRALGELLTFTLPGVHLEVHGALYGQMLLADPPEDVDPGRWDRLVKEQNEERRAAWQRYDQTQAQVGWLVNRVESLAPRSPVLRAFRTKARKLKIAGFDLDRLRYALDGQPPTQEALDQASQSTYEATRGLVDELKHLADARPPRNPTRLGQRVLSLRAGARRMKKNQPPEVRTTEGPSQG
jgi:hypothetical protein